MKQHLQYNIAKIVALVALPVFLVSLTFSQRFQLAPKELSLGILLDLLITLPVFYLLLIRKTNIQKVTVVYIFILGIIMASIKIPSDQQQLLSQVKFIAIPILEICIISMVIYKMYSLRSSLKETAGSDFYDRLLTASQHTLPVPLGQLIASEISVVYYLFSRGSNFKQDKKTFSYFKKSGIRTVIVVILFVLVVETIVVHILLAMWSTIAATVLTFLSVYAILQILSILRSMHKRPIIIDHETKHLLLRYGFGCQTSVPFSSIKHIENYNQKVSRTEEHIFLSLFDMIDSNNLTIHLNKENTLIKIYGIKKKFKSISMFIDEKEMFKKEVQKIINQYSSVFIQPYD